MPDACEKFFRGQGAGKSGGLITPLAAYRRWRHVAGHDDLLLAFIPAEASVSRTGAVRVAFAFARPVVGYRDFGIAHSFNGGGEAIGLGRCSAQVFAVIKQHDVEG